MHDKDEVIIDLIHKTSYIQYVIDTANEVKCNTSKLADDFQIIIDYAENKIKFMNDAKRTTDQIVSVLENLEKNTAAVRCKFLRVYQVWLEQYADNSSRSSNKQISEIDSEKSKTKLDESIVELDDSSSSDVEVVNEIKYLNSRKLIDSDNEKNGQSCKVSAKISSIESISNGNQKDKENSEFTSNNESRDIEASKVESRISDYSNLSTNEPNPILVKSASNLSKITFLEEELNLEKNESLNVDVNIDLCNVPEINGLISSIDYNDDLMIGSDSDECPKKKFRQLDTFESSDDSSKLYTSFSKLTKRNTFHLSKHSFLLDKKLCSNCVVILERLSNQILNKCNNRTIQNVKALEDKQFLRMIDLDSLEKRRNKRNQISSNSNSGTSDNSATESNNKVKKKVYKKQKVCTMESGINSFTTSSDESSNEDNISIHNELPGDTFSNEMLDQNEERAKQQLLRNTDSSENFDSEDYESSSSSSENTNKNRKIRKKFNESPSDTDNESDDKLKWFNDELLNFKLSDLDRNKREIEAEPSTSKEMSISSNNDTIKPIKHKRRKTKKKSKQLTLSSSNTDSSSNSDSNISSDDCKSIKENTQSSEDCQIIDVSQVPESSTINDNLLNSVTKSASKPSGRRNIRKLFEDQEIAHATKQAGKDEESRVQRLEERQQQFKASFNVEDMKRSGKLILDFDSETKKELLAVDKGLVKHLKPHQEKGVKFMWDSCFESLERAKNTVGSGCILAHCMGLGKTFQIVTLVHTLLVNKATQVNTVMVVCPMNTILNWVDEFDMWLKNVENGKKVFVYELTRTKVTADRLARLKTWHELGGVLVISYDMFRSFTSHERKLNPLQIKCLKSYLMNPGADLVVCDEGHLLKNEESLLAEKIQHVKTKRRIILTGTPLQNNLSEYHCMVQIVKPNLLGTRIEFQNRFSNPITNGQFDNSTPKDVKLMKHRAHVLHRMLEGCVQRCDYAVLTPFLPPKQEYVILLRLSQLQIAMYKYFINNIANINARNCSLFKNYHEIKRLVAHPKIIQLKAQKQKHNINSKENRRYKLDAPRDKNNTLNDWWSPFITEEHLQDLSISYKLILLYAILERCEREGDKLLIFSQCLYTLDVIEQFLEKIDKYSNANTVDKNMFQFKEEWKYNRDYFRIDGSVSSDKRNIACKMFNNPNNRRARLLLISTKAGGLGINLIGANRVILFDPSWNPSNDVQSIFRVFRFGQKKPCYVYRFLTAGTMEQKIYNRQVTKLSLSLRVLDEQQIERHYRDTELAELYKYEELNDVPIFNLPRDRVLADVLLKYRDYVYNCFEHDSLLENKEEEELDEEERKQAWFEYQQEKHLQQNTDAANKGKGKAIPKKRLLDMNLMDTLVDTPNALNVVPEEEQ